MIDGKPPWGVFEELLRATREYQFTGNKLVGFTPIPEDPPKPKYSLQVMEETSSIPDGWKIYHINNRAALNFGDISPQWHEDFISTVSPSDRPTYEWGAWTKYD